MLTFWALKLSFNLKFQHFWLLFNWKLGEFFQSSGHPDAAQKLALAAEVNEIAWKLSKKFPNSLPYVQH